MIRTDSFASIPLAQTRAAAPVSLSARSAEATGARGWFDGADLGVDICIVSSPATAARGLDVEQHAARVLMHLCGDSDAPV